MDEENKINEEIQNEEDKEINSFGKELGHEGDGHNVNPLERKLAAMTDGEYIEERLDSQMNWYDKKASFFQKKYKKIRRWEIVIAASIPVLIGFAAMNFLENTVLVYSFIELKGKMVQGPPMLTLSTIFQIIAAIGGVLIIILKGIAELEDYHKNWKEYRLTSESLRQERYKYLTYTEPYDEGDAFPMLVETVESILNKETQKWSVVSKKKEVNSDKALERVDNLMTKQDKKNKKE